MTGQFTAKLYAGTYPAIRAEFFKAVISEAARDPLGEKIVLAPSNYIAEDLYEGLSREGRKPVFNLRAMTLLDFARRLLKHRKVLVTEIDSMTRAVLLSEVVDTWCQKLGEKSTFSRIFRKKGFVSALLRIFDEFEEGMIAGNEADSLCKRPDFFEKFPDPRKMREILSIYIAFLMRVSDAGLKTRTHVVRLASDGFEVPGYLFRVRLFGFYDFTRIQWFLVEKLISSGLIDEVYFPLPTRPLRVGRMVIENFEGMQEIVPDVYRYAQSTLWQFLRQFDGNVTLLNEETYVESPAQRVRDMLFRKEFQGKKVALPFALVSAPHGPGELRAVARLIKKEMGGNGGEGKIGLVYRYLDETIVPDIERVLKEFDLPYAIAWSRPLIRTSPVRTLISLAKLPFRDYPRRETVDILSSPSFDVGKLHPGSEEESPLWDHITKKIGISKEGDWENKLHNFISKSKKLAYIEKKGSPKDSYEDQEVSRAHRPTMREIGSAETLVHCFRELKGAVGPLRSCTSFAGIAGNILDLLTRYIVIKGHEDVTGFLERAVKRTTTILNAFGELDWRGIPFLSAQSAIELLETIFHREKIPHRSSGFVRERATVIAGDIMSLRGGAFSSMYVLGANEGAWPRTKRDVSLLSDEDRDIFLSTLKEPGLPPPLSRIRDNTFEEKLLFCLPFIMSENVRALSFLRSDITGAKCVPSPFLMDLVYRFRGPDIFFKGLTGDTVGNAFHEFPRQLRDRMRAPGYPSGREVLIASLMNIHTDGTRPHLAGPARRIVLRSTETSYRWQQGEDLAPDPKIIEGIRIPEGKLNHTFLENYLHCPYKTFLRYGLKLEPFPEPEEVFSLGRLEMGLIVHKALYFIYRESRGDFTPDMLDRAVKRSIDEYGRNNPLGLKGLREIAFKNLSKTITDYLSWEKENQQGFSPEMFEVKFGFEDGYDVTIDISGEKVPFSGKIDRIDRNKETIRVLDYKLSTGNKYAPVEEKISLAILNQIPIYGIAARKILSEKGLDVKTVIGGYIALKRDRRKGYLISALLDEGDEMYARWETSLSLLFESLKARLFPPLSDTHFKLGRFRANYCAYCDYADICRVSPMTSGNDMVAHSLREKFALLFPGLSWHIAYRDGSG